MAPIAPLPPLGESFVNPIKKVTTISYTCPDYARGKEKRRLEVVFSKVDRLELRVWLKGRLLSPQASKEITNTIGKFDLLSDITPQCGRKSDVIMISGWIKQKQYNAQLGWNQKFSVQYFLVPVSR